MPGDDPNASSMPAFFDQLGRRVGRRIRMRIGVNRRLFFLMARHKSHEEEPLGWSVGDFALSDSGVSTVYRHGPECVWETRPETGVLQNSLPAAVSEPQSQEERPVGLRFDGVKQASALLGMLACRV